MKRLELSVRVARPPPSPLSETVCLKGHFIPNSPLDHKIKAGQIIKVFIKMEFLKYLFVVAYVNERL